MNPFFPPKPKRRYTLSSAGRQSLQAAAAKNKPWLQTTGPRTRLGKLIVSQNALKHGLFARDAGEQRRQFVRFLRHIRDGTIDTDTTSHPLVLPPPPGGDAGKI